MKRVKIELLNGAVFFTRALRSTADSKPACFFKAYSLFHYIICTIFAIKIAKIGSTSA